VAEPTTLAERIQATNVALRARASAVRMRPLDWFMTINLALLMTVRWVQDAEFAYYMIVMAALLVVLWRWLRRFDYSAGLLIAVQMGLFAHFAGGLIYYGPEGLRLYSHVFWGIRFDKIVHAYSCMVLVFFTWRSLQMADVDLKPGLMWMLPVFALGAGAFWEIVEFMAVVNIELTGVGDYINNTGDLIADFLGAIMATLIIAIRNERAGRDRA